MNSISKVKALNNEFIINQIIKENNINNNVSYTKLDATSSSGKQIISYVKANTSNNTKLVPYCHITEDGMKGLTVKKFAEEYQSLHPEVKVLACINADYFSTSGSMYPINSLIINNHNYKNINHTKYQSLCFDYDNNKIKYQVNKTNKISNSFYLTIYDESNTYPIKKIALSNMNNLPKANEVTFYYKNTTLVKDSATTFFEINPNAYFNLSNQYIEGTIKNLITSFTSVPVIASRNDDINKILSTNPNVVIQKEVEYTDFNYSNQIGFGSQPLKNNELIDVNLIGDQNLSFCKALHPRTSLGFTENGDIYFVTIDGRQTNMTGATLPEEAKIMKQLGCVDCFNFDGGGSTQLVINNNGTFEYLNNPSETYREVVNVLLLVEEDVSIDLDYTYKNNKLSYDYSISSDYQVNVKALLDNKLLSSNSEIDIDKNIHSLSFVGTYTKNNKELSVLLKDIYLNNSTSNVTITTLPSEFNLSYIEEEKGVNIILSYQDPDNLITKVYLLFNNQEYLMDKERKTFEYLVTQDNFSEAKEYVFKIKYYYKNTPVTTKEVLLEQEFVIYIDSIIPNITITEKVNKNNTFTLYFRNDNQDIKINTYYLKTNQGIYTFQDDSITLSIKDFESGENLSLEIDYNYNNISKFISYNNIYQLELKQVNGCIKANIVISLLILSLYLGVFIIKKRNN